MTQKEQDKLRLFINTYKVQEKKYYDNFLSFISMVDCVLAYNGYFAKWCKERKEKGTLPITEEEEKVFKSVLNNQYIQEYKDLYLNGNFGLACELIHQQMYDIKEVKRNVYTNSEGCSYNSLVYIDDTNENDRDFNNIVDHIDKMYEYSLKWQN